MRVERLAACAQRPSVHAADGKSARFRAAHSARSARASGCMTAMLWGLGAAQPGGRTSAQAPHCSRPAVNNERPPFQQGRGSGRRAVARSGRASSSSGAPPRRQNSCSQAPEQKSRQSLTSSSVRAAGQRRNAASIVSGLRARRAPDQVTCLPWQMHPASGGPRWLCGGHACHLCLIAEVANELAPHMRLRLPAHAPATAPLPGNDLGRPVRRARDPGSAGPGGGRRGRPPPAPHLTKAVSRSAQAAHCAFARVTSSTYSAAAPTAAASPGRRLATARAQPCRARSAADPRAPRAPPRPTKAHRVP